MNTPLDDWRENVTAQKALEKFWLSPEGQLCQRTLEYLGRPKASAVAGIGSEGAIQAGQLYQQSAGHFACLDAIKTLLPDPISAEKKQNDARAKLKPRTLLKEPPSAA